MLKDCFLLSIYYSFVEFCFWRKSNKELEINALLVMYTSNKTYKLNLFPSHFLNVFLKTLREGDYIYVSKSNYQSILLRRWPTKVYLVFLIAIYSNRKGTLMIMPLHCYNDQYQCWLISPCCLQSHVKPILHIYLMLFMEFFSFLTSYRFTSFVGWTQEDKMAAADIAGSLMVLEYCESKIKGKPTLAKVPQSLSCFEQTIPVSVTILNFSHSFYVPRSTRMRLSHRVGMIICTLGYFHMYK